MLRFVTNYAFFGNLWAKESVFFGAKNSVFWTRSVQLLAYIILNSICKFAITRKNDAFVAKIANPLYKKFSCPTLLSPPFFIPNLSTFSYSPQK